MKRQRDSEFNGSKPYLNLIFYPCHESYTDLLRSLPVILTLLHLQRTYWLFMINLVRLSGEETSTCTRCPKLMQMKILRDFTPTEDT
jgi:hypothetical protein